MINSRINGEEPKITPDVSRLKRFHFVLCPRGRTVYAASDPWPDTPAFQIDDHESLNYVWGDVDFTWNRQPRVSTHSTINNVIKPKARTSMANNMSVQPTLRLVWHSATISVYSTVESDKTSQYVWAESKGRTENYIAFHTLVKFLHTKSW